MKRKSKDNETQKSQKNKTEVPVKEITSKVSGAVYWLMKSEPETRLVKGKDVRFSIDDLKHSKDSKTSWEGVRNYEARNFMRDKMKLGDTVLFYHSNCKVPGIIGLAKVVKTGYPDETATDPNHPYFDKRIKDGQNPWYKVDIQFAEKFDEIISLKTLKSYRDKEVFSELSLFKRAQLSIQKVTQAQFDFIMSLKAEGGSQKG
ncbi:thymocyte nuclear protein 1, isoform CRA_b [Neoconidiobolus thromboides FSU 785]|nr:thymocyte nuclear protein 1, isoform CRA_b [Neoconidiobolus thromboides FSU 785]